MKKSQLLCFLLMLDCVSLKKDTHPQFIQNESNDNPYRGSGYRTAGAYYLEKNGDFTFICSTYSPNSTSIRSYIEKFVFKPTSSGKVLIQHFDSKCSDMLFPPEILTEDEFNKVFEFSEDGLTLRSERAINGRQMIFKWLPQDP